MSKAQLYTVTDCNGYILGSGLTEHEAVSTIYRDDGKDYRLEPVMIEVTDDDDNVTEVQESSSFDTDVKVWQVWFKDRYGWSGSCRTAYGKTEEEATEDFLNDSWIGSMWDESRFSVQADGSISGELVK